MGDPDKASLSVSFFYRIKTIPVDRQRVKAIDADADAIHKPPVWPMRIEKVLPSQRE
ncbi:MAG: hypothetical protein JSW26_21575 [Desulfobacterales bacterium]|nr:MAG: hypothetical protein JSW26_21575 [Desulfobacterales bacterium]